jgi:hypothetical protein
MGAIRRQFTQEFKLAVLRRLKGYRWQRWHAGWK